MYFKTFDILKYRAGLCASISGVGKKKIFFKFKRNYNYGWVGNFRLFMEFKYSKYFFSFVIWK